MLTPLPHHEAHLAEGAKALPPLMIRVSSQSHPGCSPSLSSVSHLLCLWEERDSRGACPPVCHHQKERTKPHAPRASCPAGCTGRASARQGWQDGGRSSPCPCCHLQELQKPCPERGQKDSEPPDPQMLHEHILRGTRAPRRRRRPPAGGCPPTSPRPPPRAGQVLTWAPSKAAGRAGGESEVRRREAKRTGRCCLDSLLFSHSRLCH